MPRYIVERTFPDGLHVSMTGDGARMCGTVVDKNAQSGVTWVQSYVSNDKTKTYCIYDGSDEAAIRASAQATGLPVDHITEVRVLDPYFYYEELVAT